MFLCLTPYAVQLALIHKQNLHLNQAIERIEKDNSSIAKKNPGALFENRTEMDTTNSKEKEKNNTFIETNPNQKRKIILKKFNLNNKFPTKLQTDFSQKEDNEKILKGRKLFSNNNNSTGKFQVKQKILVEFPENHKESEKRKNELNSPLLEMERYITPIFQDISFIENFKDFLNMEIDLIKKGKINYDSFTFDQNFIHNHYKVDKCNRENCPISKGICISTQTKKCFCNPKTLNFLKSDPENTKIHSFVGKDLCGYIQKSLLKAMFLEILFPFGLGHYYTERYLFAFMKFFSFFIIPLMIILIFGFTFSGLVKANLERSKKDLNFMKIVKDEEKFKFEYVEYFKKFILIIHIGSFLLSLVTDSLFFGLGIYKDGNGFNLV
jgi:hypothetical protein